MIGLKAERNLLTAILVDSRQYRFTHGLVSRADFSDDRMGIMFEQIGAMLARGETVSIVQVVDRFPEWGVRGVDFVEVASWDDGSVHYHGAAQYAAHVRAEGLRRAARLVGSVLVDEARDAGVAPADSLSKARTLIDKMLDDTSSGTLEVKALSEILDGSDAYDWVIPGLMEKGDRLILTGAEGAGKSTFARQLCILSAAGIHPTTFQPIEPIRVLVVDAENSERQWRRAVRWVVSRARESGSDPSGRVMVAAGKRIDITKGSHLSEIHRLVDLHKPDLLYIGPLYKITSGAIQTDDDAAPLLVALDSLRERGLAMVMEAHAAKGSSEHGREWRPRGSAALMGWPEFGLGLAQVTGDAVEVKRWRGDRDQRDWPEAMRHGRDWPWEPVRV